MSDYKRRLLDTMRELQKAIKEGDEQHAQILWHRLEIQILGRSYWT
ncbi:hypothetical protein UFOVP395_190 [uncultured Caudovirales phage]|jgi:hypothetical protein|uniref:Uncharacterized protein n=1 Tax=uncultured Caudovirales phage TaxID=2100421 RepID=A0A6J5M1P6_9CAUD|nr:hypothetical protein UFOVP395_190 [uncultured Caudovirales phage]